MPVGTGAISLTDVTAEIAGVQNSLQDCVDDHNAAGLDPTYGSTPVTSLAEFRGYEDTCLTVKLFSIFENGGVGIGWSTSTLACTSGGSATSRYFNDTTTYPENGDTIYEDSGGCTVYNGGGNWYAIQQGGTRYRFQISSSGFVSNKAACP